MKRFLRLISIMAAAAAIALLPLDVMADRPGAQRPGGQSQGMQRPTTQRPGGTMPGGSRPGVTRPGNNGGGNNGNHWGSNGNQWDSHRPGATRPGSNPGITPPTPGRPGGNVHPTPPTPPPPTPPTMRPGGNNWQPTPPPMRPNRPVAVRPFTRPMPPVGWRPSPGYPTLGGFLGLTFGTSLNVSLSFLTNNGFTIDGYADNTVYLRDPRVFNYLWNDGALFYSPSGMLTGSTFYYSTPYFDMARYNAVFNTLTTTYGLPVSRNNSGGTISATWFGSGGFITLSCNTMPAVSGSARFFTTLTFGN